MSRIAITRPVSRTIVHCELTHLAREPIDYALAAEQHHEYETALARLCDEIVHVAAAHDLPDAVFVEDTAIVWDEVAVLTRPGAVTRRPELTGVEAVLARYRDVVRIIEPGTLDGGDVLRVGGRLFVGRSQRTNDEGIAQLRALASPCGFDVKSVDLNDCLHLKSAVTAVGEATLLGNSAWVDRRVFGDVEWIEVDPSEPHAANALWIGNGVIFPRAYARTAMTLRAHLDPRGMSLLLVDASELAKAEGGLTCCSLVFEKQRG